MKLALVLVLCLLGLTFATDVLFGVDEDGSDVSTSRVEHCSPHKGFLSINTCKEVNRFSLPGAMGERGGEAYDYGRDHAFLSMYQLASLSARNYSQVLVGMDAQTGRIFANHRYGPEVVDEIDCMAFDHVNNRLLAFSSTKDYFQKKTGGCVSSFGAVDYTSGKVTTLEKYGDCMDWGFGDVAVDTKKNILYVMATIQGALELWHFDISKPTPPEVVKKVPITFSNTTSGMHVNSQTGEMFVYIPSPTTDLATNLLKVDPDTGSSSMFNDLSIFLLGGSSSWLESSKDGSKVYSAQCETDYTDLKLITFTAATGDIEEMRFENAIPERAWRCDSC